jgi:hypothetical protein
MFFESFEDAERSAAACHNNDSHHSSIRGDTMVAVNQKRVRCIVVRVPVEADFFTERGALAHDMVPGADPYVAQLIRNLQDEVRYERRLEHLEASAGRLTREARFEQADLVGDLELPWFDMPLDDEPLGEENAPEFGNEN